MPTGARPGEERVEKKHRWHCICMLSGSDLPCSVCHDRSCESQKTLGHEQESENLWGSAHYMRKFSPSSQRRATNQRFLSSLDSGKLWLDSEGLVLRPLEKRGTQQWSMVGFPKPKKRWQIKWETHTSQSFSPAMPRTSFPDNHWKSPLFQCVLFKSCKLNASADHVTENDVLLHDGRWKSFWKCNI